MRVLLGAATAALAIASVGCYARAGLRGTVAYEAPVVVYQAPVVEVETAPVEVRVVPVDVEYYPSHAYAGGSVYLVDGRWYRRSGARWVVYHAEPRALASVRVSYEAKYGRNYRPQRKAPKRHPNHSGHH